MNIQYQVIPQEYSVKFSVLQIPQQTHYIYVLDKGEWKLREYTYLKFINPQPEWYAAYTSDEMDELLPEFVIYKKITNEKVVCTYSATKLCIRYIDAKNTVYIVQYHESAVIRRAKMLICLKENNLINL